VAIVTEDQKQCAVAKLLERAKAERGLRYTAKSWRRYAQVLELHPAKDIVLGRELGDFDTTDAETTP
jgi:hypothetical protein